jgi:hypothetical protein
MRSITRRAKHRELMDVAAAMFATHRTRLGSFCRFSQEGRVEKWIPIVDEDGAETFLQRTRGLHDGLLREIVVRSRGYVTRDRLMFGDSFPMDALLRFETQQPDTPVVEVLVEDVQEVRLHDFGLDPVVRFEDSMVFLELDQPPFGRPSMVRGRQMSYRVRDVGGLEELVPLPGLSEDAEDQP